MQKASGSKVQNRHYLDYETWKLNVKKYASAPISQYEKLFKDLTKLAKLGIEVDYSQCDNLFYDEKIGFTIIDPELIETDAKVYSIIGMLVNYFSYGEDLDKEGAEYVFEICKKMSIAGESKNKISEMIEYVNKYLKKE